MNKENKTTNKYLLFGAMLTLIILIIIFSPFALDRQIVKALTNNYNKAINDSLTAGEWNFLLSDFLAKDGGTTVNGVNNAMQGDLDMGTNSIINVATPGAASPGSDAATKAYVDSQAVAATAAATDRQGNPLKMVCDSTPAGATAWQPYNPGGVYKDGLELIIYTTDDGTATGNPLFGSMPLHITSLGGSNDDLYLAIGHSSILIRTVAPITTDNTKFTVKVYVEDPAPGITPAQANLNGWFINWCAIGN